MLLTYYRGHQLPSPWTGTTLDLLSHHWLSSDGKYHYPSLFTQLINTEVLFPGILWALLSATPAIYGSSEFVFVISRRRFICPRLRLCPLLSDIFSFFIIYLVYFKLYRGHRYGTNNTKIITTHHRIWSGNGAFCSYHAWHAWNACPLPRNPERR